MKAEPLDDRVLIIPDPPEQVTPGGIIIPDSAKQYDQKKKGTVIACGPGHVAENTGIFTPIAVKVGDKVVFPAFGGQEIKGADIGMEGDYLLLREMDIDFIIGDGKYNVDAEEFERLGLDPTDQQDIDLYRQKSIKKNKEVVISQWPMSVIIEQFKFENDEGTN